MKGQERLPVARLRLRYDCVHRSCPALPYVDFFDRSHGFPKLYERKGLILHSWNSRGRVNISPASRHRTSHSSRLTHWSNSTIFPSHSVPDGLVITTTFGTAHGPTQPPMVIEFASIIHVSAIHPSVIPPELPANRARHCSNNTPDRS